MGRDREWLEVREALSRLLRRGLGATWQPSMPRLLALPAVRQRLADAPDQDVPDILREVFREVVERIPDDSYRRLLTIVLALEPTHEDLSLTDRRALAGRVFHDGNRPVGVGTIRQHHEPRALDELATLLLRPEPSVGHQRAGDDVTAASRFEWHPLVHVHWARERLSFWRLVFANYDRGVVVERLHAALADAGVSSWSMQEVLGDYDVFIRVWDPQRQVDVENVLLDAFPDTLLVVARFEVDEMIGAPSPQPPPALLEGGVSAREVRTINEGLADHDLMLRYVDRALIVPRVPTDGAGVVVTLGGPHLAVSRFARDEQAQRLLAIVDRSCLQNRALYRGVGFATFLIEGHVAYSDFGAIGHLLAEIRDAVRPWQYRVAASIASTAAPIARQEMIPVSPGPAKSESIVELLHQEEGLLLEVKACALRQPPELVRFRESDVAVERPMTQNLIRTITGFLNSSGGILLLGAIERLSHDTDNHMTDLPRVGPWIVCGVDHELEHGWEEFVTRLKEVCRNMIEPDPLRFLHFSKEGVEGRTVCAIEVDLPDEWFYERSSPRARAKFWVRQGQRTLHLTGVDADSLRASSPR